MKTIKEIIVNQLNNVVNTAIKGCPADFLRSDVTKSQCNNNINYNVVYKNNIKNNEKGFHMFIQ